MKTYEIIFNDGKVIREVQADRIDYRNGRNYLVTQPDPCEPFVIVAYLSDNVTCIEKEFISSSPNYTKKSQGMYVGGCCNPKANSDETV